jgi:hypothetical protein
VYVFSEPPFVLLVKLPVVLSELLQPVLRRQIVIVYFVAVSRFTFQHAGHQRASCKPLAALFPVITVAPALLLLLTPSAASLTRLP